MKHNYLGKSWKNTGAVIACGFGCFWSVVILLFGQQHSPIISHYLTVIVIFSALLSWYVSRRIVYAGVLPLWISWFYSALSIKNEHLWLDLFTLILSFFIFESGRMVLCRLFYLSVRREYNNIRLIKRMKRLANQDTLTEVSNRRWFDLELRRIIKQSKREQSTFSLLFIDVDYFKKYNDYYGHLCGDTCLTEIARCLISQVPEDDAIVARYGGEEFVIILDDTNLEQAEQYAIRIQHCIRTAAIPHADSDIADIITISQGLAQWEPGLSAEKLVELADSAMYQVKAQGRNGYLAFRAKG